MMARPTNSAPAKKGKRPHEEEKGGHQAEERCQRRGRPGTQHPIIELEHGQRPGQHQQIDEDAEDRRPDEDVLQETAGINAFVIDRW